MRKGILALTLAIGVSNVTTVFAEPKVMPDGFIFDAEFYVEQNPDVVAVVGVQ